MLRQPGGDHLHRLDQDRSSRTLAAFDAGLIERVMHGFDDLHSELEFWRGGQLIDRALIHAALIDPHPTPDTLRERLAAAGHRPQSEVLAQSLDRLQMSYVLVPDAAGVLRFPIRSCAGSSNAKGRRRRRSSSTWRS